MRDILTFADLINEWPNAVALAEDLGVKEVTARAWKTRGAIPAEYWTDIVVAAEARKIEGITLELLAGLAAKQAGREPLPNSSEAAE